MSGLFSQIGVAKEVRSSVATTAGAGTAGIPNTATITTRKVKLPFRVWMTHLVTG